MALARRTGKVGPITKSLKDSSHSISTLCKMEIGLELYQRILQLQGTRWSSARLREEFASKG